MPKKTRADEHQESILAWKSKGGVVQEYPDSNGCVKVWAVDANNTLHYRGSWSTPPKEKPDDPEYEANVNKLWKALKKQRADLKVH